MTKKVTVIVEGKEYIVEVGDLSGSPVRATVNQRSYQVQVPSQESSPAASKPAAAAPSMPAPAAPRSAPASAPVAASGTAITSPMPGDIIEVNVKPGDSVNPGDVVCVLEAMKMKNMIRSARTGVIASVGVAVGQEVEYGAVLVTFE